MMGFESFTREAYKLAFGEDQAFKDNLVSGRSLWIKWEESWSLFGGVDSQEPMFSFPPSPPLPSFAVCYSSDHLWDWILEAWRNVPG